MNSQKNRLKNQLFNRFPQAQRICKSSEFKEFKEKSRQKNKFTNSYFQIFFKANSFNFARMAVVVSKRVSNRAVDRNLIKRITKESFRTLQLANIDFLIIARSDCKKANNAEIATSLTSALIEISKTLASATKKEVVKFN